jgi:hypothetical protein
VDLGFDVSTGYGIRIWGGTDGIAGGPCDEVGRDYDTLFGLAGYVAGGHTHAQGLGSPEAEDDVV